jgi:hypothetical protein
VRRSSTSLDGDARVEVAVESEPRAAQSLRYFQQWRKTHAAHGDATAVIRDGGPDGAERGGKQGDRSAHAETDDADGRRSEAQGGEKIGGGVEIVRQPTSR